MLLTQLAIVLLLVCLGSCNKAPKIEKNPSNTIVNDSEPVTLECRASGDPKPKITWFKDSNPLTITQSRAKYSLLSDSDLFIISASLGKGNKSDSGTYFCRAENEHGVAQSSNASLIVAYLKDDFRVAPRSRPVSAGSSVLMECKAPKGAPEPQIWWEKDGNKLQITNSRYELVDSSLLINNVSASDTGLYVCVAKNEAAVKRSKSASLNIYDKPKLSKQVQSGNYKLNSRIELVCEAIGYPEPIIEWRKDNSDYVIKKGSTLFIPNAQYSDEGEYTCVASNSLGSVEAKASITIYEKPSFLKQMSNITIGIESKSATIECNARGKPQPVIYWAKSGLPDTPHGDKNTQDDFLILENGNLYIERLTKKYEGFYLCQASNEHGSIEMRTQLVVKSLQQVARPAPMIAYPPQNQTIPINTQAVIECKQAPSEGKASIQWVKGDQRITQQHYQSRKYFLEESGALVINAVQRTDSDGYKCIATNSNGQTNSTIGYLRVEDPNNENVQFQRNYDSSALPSSPSQPTILTTTSNSVQLSWQASAHSGHSPVQFFQIEYFSPEWPSPSGWSVLVDNIPASTNFYTVNYLRPDTYYMFVVRARNVQGYGPPGQVSDLVKTLFEPQIHLKNKNSPELIEKELSGDVIQLLDPMLDSISPASVNVTWKVFKSAYLIEGFRIKYRPIGDREFKSDIVADPKKRAHLLINLLKFTTYEITIEPFSGDIFGAESNMIQVKTKDDAPSVSPQNLQVELETVTSMSIKWQPPPLQFMNGIILGYKINCIANESKLNIYLSTNSTTRAIILGNLVEGMKYCVKVAAYTRVGVGPFTEPFKCIEMTEATLLAREATYAVKLRQIMTEPWFIAMIVILSIITLISLFYCFWFIMKKVYYESTGKKYDSETVLSVHKTDSNGNRYKLVNDTIWLDTLHSSNQSNQECCCVPDIHHQLFLQKQNTTSSILHDLRQSSLKNSFASNKKASESFHSAGKQTNMNSLKLNSSNYNEAEQPHYAEIYSANHYASTGLFLNGNDNTINTNILPQSTLGNEKNLLKYIHASQSQANTPRVPIRSTQTSQRTPRLPTNSIYNFETGQIIGYVPSESAFIALNEPNSQSIRAPALPRQPPPKLNNPNNYENQEAQYNLPWNINLPNGQMTNARLTSTLSRLMSHQHASPARNYILTTEEEVALLHNAPSVAYQEYQPRIYKIMPVTEAQLNDLSSYHHYSHQNEALKANIDDADETNSNNLQICDDKEAKNEKKMAQSWLSDTSNSNQINEEATATTSSSNTSSKRSSQCDKELVSYMQNQSDKTQNENLKRLIIEDNENYYVSEVV